MGGNEGEIVLFTSSDGEVVLPVVVDAEKSEVWLNRIQMAELFGRDVKTIGKHISNALREELSGRDEAVVAKIVTTASDGKIYQVEHYALDIVLSVGYRVKSRRGVEFRRWATDVLHRYIMKGRAENEARLRQLAQTIDVIERLQEPVGAREILDIVESYTGALRLLDEYDRERVVRPKGVPSVYVLDYEECVELIEQMRSRFSSDIYWPRAQIAYDTEVARCKLEPELAKIKPWSGAAAG